MNGQVGSGREDRLRQLRETACRLNRGLAQAGLVTLAFGNASVTDRALGVMAIKPSGIACEAVTPDDLVLLDVDDGSVIDGRLRPSSDTATHLVLVRAFATATAVIHTHSTYASSWAQARRPIPCLGTTHADHFSGPVPVTRDLSPDEIASDYTTNTGRVIVERFETEHIDPASVPAALVAGHGPFAWGESAEAALTNAVALELVATMALATFQLRPDTPELDRALSDHHHERKHGPRATYGQRSTVDQSSVT